MMTRIRTSTLVLRKNTTDPQLYTAVSTESNPMESSIMNTADALTGGGPGEMVVVEDVPSSSIHQPEVPLMNGITVTLANGDNKYDVADKDGTDLPAIDFASATNHNNANPRTTPPDGADDKMRCYATDTVAEDNEPHTMMMVDSVGATETAHCSSRNSSSSNSSSSSSSNSSCASSSSAGSSSGSSTSHPEPDEPEGDEEDDVEEEGEEEEEEEEEDDENEPHREGEEVLHDGSRVDESASVDKLHMMQTDDDPLLQATINALMNGTDAIEVVNTSDHHQPPEAATAAESDMTTVTPAEMHELDTDRNYECTYCGKLFTRSNTLAYHLKVHTGERPFKCKHCAKAFREQYRLMKHLKTHSKYRNRRLERGSAEQADRAVARSVQSHLHRFGLVSAGEEDYATGDSERFFKNYEMPEGTITMKLEPDISLTEDADVSEVGPDAMLTTEVVEEQDDVGVPDPQDAVDGTPEGVVLTDGGDVRYQIIEERIKSLQREVHLVNQNLNRVESKVDGLTRIISLFIGKFEDETELANHAAQQQQQQQQPQQQQQQTEDVPVASLTVVTQQQPSSNIPATSASPTVQPKTIFLTSSTPQTQPAHPAVHQSVSIFTTANGTLDSVGQSSSPVASQPPVSLAKDEPPHFYQFADGPPVVHGKTEPPSVSVSVSSPSPTPASPQTQQQLALTSAVPNGNQLLDTFPEIPELPIRTVSDFLDLNDHCTDNEQFLLQMMIRLHQEIHNSQPFQRNIKRMMEALVTYEVLCQFSWSGKSAINGQYTKYVFGNSLGIIDLLTKTLNLGKSAEEAEANQKPIFAAIQSFIKHSRQNMMRDSRKRRDPMRPGPGGVLVGGGDMVAGMTVDGSATISYHVNGGGERLQIKQYKSDRHHHHHPPTEPVQPF